jgi:hypothetical protein
MTSQHNQPTIPWTRSVTWRQGSVLRRETRDALGLVGESLDCIQIVISNDCDCVQDEDKEPAIEVIAGAFIELTEVKDECTYGRNPRILHLSATRQGQRCAIECHIDGRSMISKRDLVSAQPDDAVSLSDQERLTLVRWVAGRYNRAALPDALTERLKAAKNAFKGISKRHPFAILGIYLDYDPRGEIESDDEPYELRIAVVYDSSQDGAEEQALEAKRTIERRLELKFKTLETETAGIQWRLIELTNCEAIADTVFSLRNALDYKLYQLEYASLATDPPAESPSAI